MKNLLLIATLLIAMPAFAQSDFDRSKDKETGSVVFKGQISFEDLKSESTFSWLKRGAADYKPDSIAIAYLKKNLPKYEMVVLMGTWCDDSHNLVPKLYKVMQASGYPMSNYKMYGVDRAKEAKYVEHKLYRLEKVPTIILLKDHVEIGRIVESVKKSVEIDLVQMIQKKMDEEERGQ